MPLFRPSELRAYLETLGVRPKKSLSQNFLIDGNILKKIAKLADLQSGDLVIEIGPGPGVLTELLLEKGCSVIAIEKDRVFAKSLVALKEKGLPLEVHSADIMDFDLEGAIRAKGFKEKAKVVANIPYHLTTPIIQKIFALSRFIQSATLMVQDEMAKRCIAAPGSKDYSSFSIFLQYYSNPHYGFFVPSGCFYPSPKVGSAVIFLDLVKKYQVSDEEKFFQMTRTAFGQRRKMLKSSLKDIFEGEKIEKALGTLGLSIKCRPEELSLEAWVRFFENITT